MSAVELFSLTAQFFPTICWACEPGHNLPNSQQTQPPLWQFQGLNLASDARSLEVGLQDL